jgi:hypothetical protein
MNLNVQQLTKPMPLFFGPKYGPAVPAFQVTNRDTLAHCLDQFFDLGIIEGHYVYSRV